METPRVYSVYRGNFRTKGSQCLIEFSLQFCSFPHPTQCQTKTKGLFWPDVRSCGTVSLSLIGCCLFLASSLAGLISSSDQTLRRDSGRSLTLRNNFSENDSDRLQSPGLALMQSSCKPLFSLRACSESKLCRHGRSSRERAFHFLLLKAFLWILSGLKQSCSNSQGPAPHSTLRNIPMQTQEICKIFNEFLFSVVHSISSFRTRLYVLDILARNLIEKCHL